MKIKTITLLDFMSHKHSVIDLPETGLVLVTGENGAGKSSMVEAVAWAVWGKTLRGSKMGQCGASVVTDRVDVARSKGKAGKKSGLQFSVVGESEEREFDTPTKAQLALEGVVGDMDLWRRTSVFSSADASHFTLSTDAERKRLLEDLLGLHKFDAALSDVRLLLKEEEAAHNVAASSLSRCELRWEAADRRWRDAEAGLAELPPAIAAELPDELQTAREQMAALKQRKAPLQEAHNEAAAEIREATAAIAAAQRALREVADAGCPTCGQDWPDEASREKRRNTLRAALLDAEKAQEAARGKAEKVRAEIESVDGESEQVRSRGVAIKEQIDAYGATLKTRERLAAQEEAAMEELAAIQQERDGLKAEAAATAATLGVLKACERVLGVRGVRAHVLGKALGGIETVANAWLSRIARADAPLQLSLNPYTEKKAGGVSDAIALEVTGAGGGTGYAGASGGERRRIDVALLMALAEVAQAGQGVSGGTLFFDEVFDSLDKAGTEAVIGALAELSQERTVVVISHSDDLIQQIPAGTHMHVAKGKVQRC